MTKGKAGMKTLSERQTTCAQCSRSLNHSRPWQRFCSKPCRLQWHAEERRQALAAYRSEERNFGRHELEHVPIAAGMEGP